MIFITALPMYLAAADLQKDQAIVILGIEDKNRNIDTLMFREYLTGETFDVKTFFNPGTKEIEIEPKTVTGGNYYLDKIMTVSDLVPPIVFSKPDKVDSTFRIFPGTVTYIGTWHFDDRVRSDVNTRLQIKRDYPESVFLKLADKYQDLTNHTLIIATEEGELFRGDWGKAGSK